MLKVLIYGYLTNLYSSRKIEQALHQNIHFMWLSGMSYPDHNTINRFRSERLKGVLKEVFSQVVHLLVDHGHVTLKEVYLDGTKIEANANRYTFVWGRAIKTSKERIKKQLRELWSYAEKVAKEELENNEPDDFEQIDAGYGSEQNYEYLENKGIEAFVKYNYFHKEQTKKCKEDPRRIENLHYNPDQDCYYCPMGQPMTFIGTRQNQTAIGYVQNKKVYQAQNCKGCPIRGSCHKAKENRKIEVNPRLIQYKEVIKDRLNSERGQHYRSQRPIEPEAVFGNIKNNHGFRRFMLRGLEKVEIEAGLLALVHNLAKLAN
jgi:IS5 family transposase